MSEENEPAIPAEPAEPSDPIQRAAAILQSQAAAREEAPAPEATAPPTPDAGSSLADEILGFAEPKDKGAIDAEDPTQQPKIAKLLELERAQRTEAMEIERMRAELAAREKELDTRSQTLTPLQQAAKLIEEGRRLEAIKLLGLNYTDLAAEAVNGQPADLSPALKKIAELEAKLAELPKTWEEKLEAEQAKREEAQFEAWKERTGSRLRSDGDRWGLLTDPRMLAGEDPVEKVLRLMEKHNQQTGEWLTEEQAADILEDSLERRIYQASGSGRETKFDRLIGKRAPIAPAKSPPGGAEVEKVPPQTLSNGQTGDAPERPDRPRTDAEYQAMAKATAERLFQK